MEGKNLVLIIDVENSGKGLAKDVRIELQDFELKGVKSKYLGKIDANENLPARFVLGSNKAGIYEGNINLQYSFGGELHKQSFPFEVQIFPKEKNLYLILVVFLIFISLSFILIKKFIFKSG
jgi:hypothetical protein